jgi:hypothetical protein
MTGGASIRATRYARICMRSARTLFKLRSFYERARRRLASMAADLSALGLGDSKPMHQMDVTTPSPAPRRNTHPPKIRNIQILGRTDQTNGDQKRCFFDRFLTLDDTTTSFSSPRNINVLRKFHND